MNLNVFGRAEIAYKGSQSQSCVSKWGNKSVVYDCNRRFVTSITVIGSAHIKIGQNRGFCTSQVKISKKDVKYYKNFTKVEITDIRGE